MEFYGILRQISYDIGRIIMRLTLRLNAMLKFTVDFETADEPSDPKKNSSYLVVFPCVTGILDIILN